AYIFDDIVVVTDQDATPPAVEFKEGVAVAGYNVRIDKRMKFTVTGNEPAGSHGDIGFVEGVRIVFFKQPCQYGDVMLPGNGLQPVDTRPSGNRFGNGEHLLPGEMPRECVARDAALMKRDGLRTLP